MALNVKLSRRITLDGLDPVNATRNLINFTNLGVGEDRNVALGYKSQASYNKVAAGNEPGYNVAIGYECLFLNQTSKYNVAIGYECGKFFGDGADKNVLIGYKCGKATISDKYTGTENTFIGNECGKLNTTGTLNVAIGSECFRENLIGIGNTSIGQGALVTNSSGDNNVAIGYKALAYSETSDNNIAVGQGALNKQTNAGGSYTVEVEGQPTKTFQFGDNIAIGKSSGFYINSTYNILIGSECFQGEGNDPYNSSNQNVAIGYHCGKYANTGANNNVLIGYQCAIGRPDPPPPATSRNFAGSNNVVIGSDAGNTLSTGSKNVLIGYNTQASSATVQQELKIGSETLTWISGNSSGNVGINKLPSSHKLDVNGTVANNGTQLSSDDRIKYNKQDINGTTAINVINQLNPQKYEKIIQHPQDTNGVWIPTDAEWSETERDATIDITDDEGNVTTKAKWKWYNEIGLIAQDIKLINELQNSVNGEEVDVNGNQTTLSLNYNDIFTYHIAATKQLINELNAEKNKTSTLETKVSTLETELEAIKIHVGFNN